MDCHSVLFGRCSIPRGLILWGFVFWRLISDWLVLRRLNICRLLVAVLILQILVKIAERVSRRVSRCSRELLVTILVVPWSFGLVVMCVVVVIIVTVVQIANLINDFI